jgi:hypothetical protein
MLTRPMLGLVAGLLALTSGVEGAGAQSELAALAASMEPGTWAELTTSGLVEAATGTGGATNLVFPYADSTKWDPVARRALFIGSDHGGHPTPGPTASFRFIELDEIDNAWRILPTPPWAEVNVGGAYNDAHGYDKTAIDAEGRRLFRNPYNSTLIRVYDLDADTWSTLPETDLAAGGACCDAIEWFPERGGLVWSRGTGGQYFYDASSETWSALGSESSLGSTWMFAEHDPVHHVVLLGSSTGALFVVPAAGALEPRADIPGEVSIYDGSGWNGVVTVDPVSGDYLVLSAGERRLHVYDVVEDRWEIAVDAPPDPSVESVQATPIPGAGVVMFTHCDGGDCGVWLYKHAATTPMPSGDDAGARDGGRRDDAGDDGARDGGTRHDAADLGRDASGPVEPAGGCSCRASASRAPGAAALVAVAALLLRGATTRAARGRRARRS